MKFGHFTLKSGVQSPVYVDLRVMVAHPKMMVGGRGGGGADMNQIGGANMNQVGIRKGILEYTNHERVPVCCHYSPGADCSLYS